MKIGLCIKFNNHNYGSQLQSFAMINYLKKQGYDFEIIDYKKNKNINYVLVMSTKFLLNRVFRNDVCELLKKKFFYLKNRDFRKKDSIRYNKFSGFIKENFIDVNQVNGYKKLVDCSSKYDIVISGSDQLWSPGGLTSNFFNLQFCVQGVKRVSWASSFGVSKIPSYQIKRTKDYLYKMDCISVRENSAAKIIFDLIEKNVPVVCDPVMMLTISDWNDLIPNDVIINKKYIFTYFLGDNPEQRKFVTEFAQNNNLIIVMLPHLDQFIPSDESFGDYKPYDVGPTEFLNFIRNAEYIFTDSFHGTVFSILNHKKFLVFNRYSVDSKVSKNSRIDTILDAVELNRKFTGNINVVKEDIDYHKVEFYINIMRQKASDYLLEVLKK